MDQLLNMRELVQAYEEIAVTRMQKSRTSVLKTRDFLGGLTEIFQEVKASYQKEIRELMRKRRIKDRSKISLIKRNGKAAAVLLSSHTGLYGSIVKKTYNLFIDFVKKTNSDAVLVGRLGKVYFQNENPDIKYRYIDFPDNKVEQSILLNLIKELLEYEKIIVFFGEFQNIVSQTPVMLDIYGNESLTSAEVEKKPTIKYFFEPSLENLMIFFESEIFTAIFEQTIQESNLAKFASRILNLDAATENISLRLSKVQLENRLLKHRLFNRKQQSSLSSISLWS